MRGFGAGGYAGHANPPATGPALRVTVIATAGALLLIGFAGTFSYTHFHLSRAVHGHGAAAHNIDWDAVFQAAQTRTQEEFVRLYQGGTSDMASGKGTGGNCPCLVPSQNTAPCPAAKPLDCPTSPCPACPAHTKCPTCPDCSVETQSEGILEENSGSDSDSNDSSHMQSDATDSEGDALQADTAPAWTPNVTLAASPWELAIDYPLTAWRKHLKGSSEAPVLTTPLARTVAVNNQVIVTWANDALFDFVQNFVKHLVDLRVYNFFVGAMDSAIGHNMVQRNIPCFAMYQNGESHSGVGTDHLAWGGKDFHKMGRQKITLAKLFLGLGLDLLLVDVDVVILKDVLPYFARYPEADILVSSDQLASTTEVGDDGLERPELAGSPMNIGIMFFRYNANTTAFVDVWLRTILADDNYWDQYAFNDLARLGWDPLNKVHPDNKRVFLGYNGTVAVGVLPVAMFCGGHTFYVQRLYEVQQVEPYAVHCTFQYGANIGKRNRMREAKIFEDPPAYYTGDRYVSVDLKRMPSMTWQKFNNLSADGMKAYHYKGLDMQLEVVWPGLAISLVFNRSFILPPLACYCDKYWTDLDKCRVPGAHKERIPFLCPMDHVLDPNFMVDPASTWVVSYREHSFLKNPRCPSIVKRSKLTIYTSKAYRKPHLKHVVQEGGAVLLLPAGLTQKQLQAVLRPYEDYQVWHFKDAVTAFGGFDDPNLKAAFDPRVDHLKPRPPLPKSPALPPPATASKSTAPQV